MTSYIIRRLLLIIPTVFVALSLLFGIFFLLPGDPAALIAGGGDRTVDQGVMERIEHRYGLDDPIPVQFVNYWQRTLRWDLGESFLNRREPSTTSSARRRSTASAWPSGRSSSRSSSASPSACCRRSAATPRRPK